MIETGPAQVHILCVGVVRQQLQQTRQDDIIIVIHMTEPPIEKREEDKDNITAIMLLTITHCNIEHSIHPKCHDGDHISIHLNLILIYT